MDGRLGNHSWCMGVVSNGYVGLDGGRDGGGGRLSCGRKPAVGRMSGDAGTQYPV